MKMRNMKRQLLLSALLSCGLLSAAAVIDDFETGVRGWGGWCDAQSESARLPAERGCGGGKTFARIHVPRFRHPRRRDPEPGRDPSRRDGA